MTRPSLSTNRDAAAEPAALSVFSVNFEFIRFLTLLRVIRPELGGEKEIRVARAPAEIPTSRQLLLLGGFEFRWAGRPVTVQRGGQRLLALLALQPRRLERLYVAGTLWSHAAEERAAANLRSALWRLPQPGGAPVVETSVTHLRLASDVNVDLHDVSAEMEQLDQASSAVDELTAAPGLTRDLLPDWYEDWVLLERERFRQLRLHALEARCARLIELGRFGAAVQAGLAAVAGEPLRESAHRSLIQAHLAEGNPGEALRQYRLYRRLLNDELAIEPSPAIRSLVAPLAS
jgi:DNA-binding SARP family transcriptional activator